MATGTAPLTVNSTTMVGNLNAQYLGGYENTHFAKTYDATYIIDNWNNFNPASSTNRGVIVRVDDNVKLGVPQTGICNWSLYQQGNSMRGSQLALGAYGGNEMYYRSAQNDDNVWRPWVKLYHSGNLTSSLTTNYIPKWNGSAFINSLISDDGIAPSVVKSAGDSYYKTTSGTATALFGTDATAGFISSNGDLMWYAGNRINNFYKNVKIVGTTPSTSPTTGALVVNGGVGADHVRANNFYGNGSNLTGVQLPIALTTTGTSGAATFSGNVLNVPNYGSGIVSTTSGTYTPTQTIVTNINSGTQQSNGVVYTKVGNIYTISMSGSFTSTSSGSSQIDISLPEAASSFVGSFLAVSTTSDGGQNRVAWVATSGNGGTFIRLWTSPTGSESIKYYITGQYVSQ